MHVIEALERHGGVADAATVVRLTSRAQLRRAFEHGEVVRDGVGHYALPGADAALRRARELSGVLCLDSAARMHGWKLKHVPRTPAVAVPRKRKVSANRRHGLRLVYLDLAPHEIDGAAAGSRSTPHRSRTTPSSPCCAPSPWTSRGCTSNRRSSSPASADPICSTAGSGW